MRVSGSVRFRAPPAAVYIYLARTVLTHALAAREEEILGRTTTILTRYDTKLWVMTVVTTEEATLEPGRRITWRHVDGPLTGSVETFRIEPAKASGAVVRYEGRIRARNRWLRGPLEWLLLGPLTRMISMRALKDAKRALDGGNY